MADDIDRFKDLLSKKLKLIPLEDIKYFQEKLENKKFFSQANYYVSSNKDKIIIKTLNKFPILMPEKMTSEITKKPEETITIFKEPDSFKEGSFPDSGEIVANFSNLWSLHLKKMLDTKAHTQDKGSWKEKYMGIVLKKAVFRKVAYAFARLKNLIENFEVDNLKKKFMKLRQERQLLDDKSNCILMNLKQLVLKHAKTAFQIIEKYGTNKIEQEALSKALKKIYKKFIKKSFSRLLDVAKEEDLMMKFDLKLRSLHKKISAKDIIKKAIDVLNKIYVNQINKSFGKMYLKSLSDKKNCLMKTNSHSWKDKYARLTSSEMGELIQKINMRNLNCAFGKFNRSVSFVKKNQQKITLQEKLLEKLLGILVKNHGFVVKDAFWAYFKQTKNLMKSEFFCTKKNEFLALSSNLFKTLQKIYILSINQPFDRIHKASMIEKSDLLIKTYEIKIKNLKKFHALSKIFENMKIKKSQAFIFLRNFSPDGYEYQYFFDDGSAPIIVPEPPNKKLKLINCLFMHFRKIYVSTIKNRFKSWSLTLLLTKSKEKEFKVKKNQTIALLVLLKLYSKPIKEVVKKWSISSEFLKKFTRLSRNLISQSKNLYKKHFKVWALQSSHIASTRNSEKKIKLSMAMITVTKRYCDFLKLWLKKWKSTYISKYKGQCIKPNITIDQLESKSKKFITKYFMTRIFNNYIANISRAFTVFKVFRTDIYEYQITYDIKKEINVIDHIHQANNKLTEEISVDRLSSNSLHKLKEGFSLDLSTSNIEKVEHISEKYSEGNSENSSSNTSQRDDTLRHMLINQRTRRNAEMKIIFSKFHDNIMDSLYYSMYEIYKSQVKDAKIPSTNNRKRFRMIKRALEIWDLYSRRLLFLAFYKNIRDQEFYSKYMNLKDKIKASVRNDVNNQNKVKMLKRTSKIFRRFLSASLSQWRIWGIKKKVYSLRIHQFQMIFNKVCHKYSLYQLFIRWKNYEISRIFGPITEEGSDSSESRDILEQNLKLVEEFSARTMDLSKMGRVSSRSRKMKKIFEEKFKIVFMKFKENAKRIFVYKKLSIALTNKLAFGFYKLKISKLDEKNCRFAEILSKLIENKRKFIMKLLIYEKFRFVFQMMLRVLRKWANNLMQRSYKKLLIHSIFKKNTEIKAILEGSRLKDIINKVLSPIVKKIINYADYTHTKVQSIKKVANAAEKRYITIAKNAFEKLKNNIKKDKDKEKKMAIKKTKAHALRAGRRPQKTVTVKRIFYKCLGMHFNRFKTNTLKVQQGKDKMIILQKSIKILGKNMKALMHQTFKIWKANVVGKKSQIKQRLLISIRDKYHIILQKAMKHFSLNVSIQKTTYNLKKNERNQKIANLVRQNYLLALRNALRKLQQKCSLLNNLEANQKIITEKIHKQAEILQEEKKKLLNSFEIKQNKLKSAAKIKDMLLIKQHKAFNKLKLNKIISKTTEKASRDAKNMINSHTSLSYLRSFLYKKLRKIFENLKIWVIQENYKKLIKKQHSVLINARDKWLIHIKKALRALKINFNMQKQQEEKSKIFDVEQRIEKAKQQKLCKIYASKILKYYVFTLKRAFSLWKIEFFTIKTQAKVQFKHTQSIKLIILLQSLIRKTLTKVISTKNSAKFKSVIEKASTIHKRLKKEFIVLWKINSAVVTEKSKIAIQKRKTKILRSGRSNKKSSPSLSTILMKNFRIAFDAIKTASLDNRISQTANLQKKTILEKSFKNLRKNAILIIKTSCSRWEFASKAWRLKKSKCRILIEKRYKLIIKHWFDKLNQGIEIYKRNMAKQQKRAIVNHNKKNQQVLILQKIIHRSLIRSLNCWRLYSRSLRTFRQKKAQHNRLMISAINIMISRSINRQRRFIIRWANKYRYEKGRLSRALTTLKQHLLLIKKTGLTKFKQKVDRINMEIEKNENYKQKLASSKKSKAILIVRAFNKSLFYYFFKWKSLTNLMSSAPTRRTFLKEKQKDHMQKVFPLVIFRRIKTVIDRIVRAQDKQKIAKASIEKMLVSLKKAVKNAFSRMRTYKECYNTMEKNQSFMIGVKKLQIFIAKILVRQIRFREKNMEKLIVAVNVMRKSVFVAKQNAVARMKMYKLESHAAEVVAIEMRGKTKKTISSISKIFSRNVRNVVVQWHAESSSRQKEKCMNLVILRKLLKELTVRTLSHSFISIAMQKDPTKKYAGNLWRVMDRVINKKQLKNKFRILQSLIQAGAIKLNNNLWRMKNNELRTSLENHYEKKIKKVSTFQEICRLLSKYRQNLLSFTFTTIKTNSSSKSSNYSSGLKKIQLIYIFNLKRSFDKWNSQIKSIIDSAMISYTHALAGLTRFFSTNIAKSKSSHFLKWKNHCAQTKTKKLLSCMQMKLLHSNQDKKLEGFLKKRSIDKLKLFIFAQDDPKIGKLQRELEETKLKAKAYYADLIKLKNYNSFLFARVKK